MAERDANGRWLKGASGNPGGYPGGRPKAYVQIKELAREHTVEAIETLVAVMRDIAAPVNARVAAANAILDRGWGRPAPVDPETGEAMMLSIEMRTLYEAQEPVTIEHDPATPIRQ